MCITNNMIRTILIFNKCDYFKQNAIRYNITSMYVKFYIKMVISF